MATGKVILSKALSSSWCKQPDACCSSKCSRKKSADRLIYIGSKWTYRTALPDFTPHSLIIIKSWTEATKCLTKLLMEATLFTDLFSSLSNADRINLSLFLRGKKKPTVASHDLPRMLGSHSNEGNDKLAPRC